MENTAAKTDASTLPVFFGDILKNMFDGSDGISAIGFSHRNVTVAAHGHFAEGRRD